MSDITATNCGWIMIADVDVEIPIRDAVFLIPMEDAATLSCYC